MTLFQQGDVLLFTIDFIPTTAKPKKDRVIAHGEVTGHAHRLTEASDGLLYETDDGSLYLHVGVLGATISHEEHASHTLAPGDYRVARVREYDHFSEEARQVRD